MKKPTLLFLRTLAFRIFPLDTETAASPTFYVSNRSPSIKNQNYQDPVPHGDFHSKHQFGSYPLQLIQNQK